MLSAKALDILLMLPLFLHKDTLLHDDGIQGNGNRGHLVAIHLGSTVQDGMFAVGTGDVILVGHVYKDIQWLILEIIDIKDTVNALTRMALGALTYLIFRQVIFKTHTALETGEKGEGRERERYRGVNEERR